jgi:hypothetical protein
MMNKRILKLAKQAGYRPLPGFNFANSLEETYLQKFAHLIVLECLSNMKNCDGDLDFAIWKTKKDFGVEK